MKTTINERTNKFCFHVAILKIKLQPFLNTPHRGKLTLIWTIGDEMLLCYIIAEGFLFISSFFVGYILSFGLVRLRTIRLSERAGAHIECSSCLLTEDVTITNVIMKTPDRTWKWGENDVMAGSDGLGILVIFEKSSYLRFGLGRGQSSCGLRDAPRVCWVSELRFWL